MKSIHGNKKVPSFWNKFFWEDGKIKGVHVKSDIEKFPYIAYFPRREGSNDLQEQVELAIDLINELNAGRVTVKNAMKEFL